MEVTKFWTKTKIILLISTILLIGAIVGIVFLYRNSMAKKYQALEEKFSNAAGNYLAVEGIVLTNDYREIDIKAIEKKGLVTSDLIDDCEGYVISELDNKGNLVSKTYLKCKSIYTTLNYGKKTTDKKQNKTKTQTENDTTKPVITLLGSEKVTVSVGSKYKDKGAMAQDNVDGDLTKKIKVTSDVDTSKVGEYKVTYSVKDKAGNKATKTRKVIVQEGKTEEKEEKDTTAPVIVFTHPETYQKVCKNDKLDISKTGVYGYTAMDDVDGDLTSKVKITGTTNTSKLGTFTLTYKVSDKSKNEAVATRKFDVIDCSKKEESTPVTPTPAPTPVTPTPTPTPTPSGGDSGGSGGSSSSSDENPYTPSSVTILPSSISVESAYVIGIGGTINLNASVIPANATDKSLYYSSTNSSVASVDAYGNVRGNSAGEARIIITTSNNIQVGVSVYVN